MLSLLSRWKSPDYVSAATTHTVPFSALSVEPLEISLPAFPDEGSRNDTFSALSVEPLEIS